VSGDDTAKFTRRLFGGFTRQHLVGLSALLKWLNPGMVGWVSNYPTQV
jgi:hypothetical protein